MLDLIVHNILIYDGTGAAPRLGEVAIEGDTIASVDSDGSKARETIDGRGLAIAPGFIDVHTHDDFAAVLHPDMAFKTEGGVTTCVVGNCGMGAAPWRQAAQVARAFDSQTLPPWEGYRGYFALLGKQPPATNIAALIGHGTVRQAAMGADAREPTITEMHAMKASISEGLDAGAVGLSTGLIYDPGRHAQTDEIVELASLMRGSGALYATHMRDEGLGLLASVAEAIAIGERAGVGVQISHHKASGKKAWGLVTESLKLIENAQRRGLDVHADQYPYTAGSTVLSAVFRDGGLGVNAPADVVIASTKSHSEWEGRSIAQIAEAMACDWRQAAANILAAEPNSTVVLHMMCEDDVRTVMRHPSTMIGSDGLPTLDGKPHPRLYGTFARVLGRYARDEGLFPLEEAIYRMTGFPAAKFGFSDRGELKVGAKADLVLFNPDRIIDRGTFENPKCSPEGIAAVYVNGQLTVQNGRATAARGGRVLRQ